MFTQCLGRGLKIELSPMLSHSHLHLSICIHIQNANKHSSVLPRGVDCRYCMRPLSVTFISCLCMFLWFLGRMEGRSKHAQYGIHTLYVYYLFLSLFFPEVIGKHKSQAADMKSVACIIEFTVPCGCIVLTSELFGI